MEFSESRTYDHPAEDIFDIMANFEELASTFPQVSAYEKLSDNDVRITIDLDFGKFSGSYFADFKIHDLSRPNNIQIDGKHKSGIGGMNLNMQAQITIISQSSNTLTVSGTFKRSGLVSWASKSMIKGGMDIAVKFMFDLVDEQLERLAMFKGFAEEE